ncbi:MAG: polysaccharide deacetylase family protein [Candidatus Omnitrophica bacterium]|nr:polysaccharide deacetylase family protein [Candidatus Omnitrophota bacterium]
MNQIDKTNEGDLKDKQPITNVLTVDVEEWYQTFLFYNTVYNDQHFSSLPRYMNEILDLFEEYQAQATFFVLGSVAEKYPELIRDMVRRGHEVASHGYSHQLVNRMTQQEFIHDVSVSLDILKSITGCDILGYRASTWSITKNITRAMQTLRSLGLKYDSSLYPVSRNIFRCSQQQCCPYEIIKGFIEFSPSTFRFLGCNCPFAGGTFLRFLPISFIRNRIRSINKIGQTAMIYFHPWEFYAVIPEARVPLWKNVIQWGNLPSVRRKLRCLLQEFKFSCVRDVINLNDS